MVLQALHPSSNYLHTKSKSTILRPTLNQAPLAFYCQIVFFLDGSFKSTVFFHLSLADNVIAFGCSFVIYHHRMFSSLHFQNFLSTFSIERVNGGLFGISARATFKEH